MSKPNALVSNRSVFLMGGYEPKSSEAFFKRMRRELARFCETWQVSAEMSEKSVSPNGQLATAHIEANLHGNRVSTDINFFVWNDLVLRDFAKPTLVRVGNYIVTFLDYLTSGTFYRIVRQAWRFSLYFLYPACMLALFGCIAIFAGWAISRLAVPAAGLIGTVGAIFLWLGLLRWSGRRWFVLHLMDLWSFSRNHLRGLRPDSDALIDSCADAVVRQARRAVDDEIILVGHSTGGALILEILAVALAKEPNLGRLGPSLTVLTVGSTALKIGLHPAAVKFRQCVQTLIDAPEVNWIECQAHTDIMNFYKTDPVAAMNLLSTRKQAFPKVHLVRIRDMLQPEVYKRFKFNLFRVHYQFIMANTQRYAYDFFMMCCGEKLSTDILGDSLLIRTMPVDFSARDSK